uniref:Protein kinase domain-containing protein n=1 Tax=Aegilops tauschii subsp. strangulata TaxID=200361 RepID=A0A453CQ11_AEGTS
AEGINDSQRWEIICKLSIGIVKGLDHLHTRSQKPIIHGNLKTSNIMLDADFQPRVSDFGLYLLLNPAAAQDMLETAAVQGYKAPELIKMREVTRESDVYSRVRTQGMRRSSTRSSSSRRLAATLRRP